MIENLEQSSGAAGASVVRVAPKPYRVMLCDEEVHVVIALGAQRKGRHYCARHRGEGNLDRSLPRHDFDPLDFGLAWKTPIATCAEYGVARELGRFWSFDYWTKTHTVDIPPDIEVRWSSKDWLVVYPRDNPSFKVVLVQGVMPEFFIMGWAYAKEGHAKPLSTFFQTPYHKIPLNELRPFEELIRLTNSETHE